MRTFAVHLLALAPLIARGADASTLYMLASNTLFQVDPATGQTHAVASVPDPGWIDLEGRPGDSSKLYGTRVISSIPSESRISTIDVHTGAVTDLVSFRPSDFGYTQPPFVMELYGLAISASQPSSAVVSGVIFNGASFPYEETILLFDVDLNTGAKSNVQTLASSDIFSLAYSNDGTLFALEYLPPTAGDPNRQLATIDRSTGSVDEFGVLQSTFRIALDPSSDLLYAIDGRGMLVQLSQTTGEALDVGPTGFGGLGAKPMAFIVPEPGTGVLLMLGLIGYGIASNGRGGSRGTSRRA